ncbi:MAG: rhodanese-related sulfurtransferase [Planctomycetaceae bacterium]|nr:rhodanese-related sulfurtransferase [Planctomycetaceae bacterium]
MMNKVEKMSHLQKLQNWFAAECDGDWEHQNGIDIKTLDNPGWEVKIDLFETSKMDIPFETVMEKYEDPVDWMHLKKEDNKLVGAGGPEKLDKILTIFAEWLDE